MFADILPEIYRWTRKSPLNFGSHSRLDSDSETFNGIFAVVEPCHTPQRWACVTGCLFNNFAGSATLAEVLFDTGLEAKMGVLTLHASSSLGLDVLASFNITAGDVIRNRRTLMCVALTLDPEPNFLRGDLLPTP